MAKKAVKKTTKKAAKKHPLMREIPVLNSLLIILYVLLGICFIAIYLTRFV